MTDFRPIVCVDFDGCAHDYMEGYKDGTIYGNAVPGFFEWVERVGERVKLVIYSSRSKSDEGIEAMRLWMAEQARSHCSDDMVRARKLCGMFLYAAQKPAAWLTIDDRAIQFRGSWEDAALTPDAILAFRPWNVPAKK